PCRVLNPICLCSVTCLASTRRCLACDLDRRDRFDRNLCTICCGYRVSVQGSANVGTRALLRGSCRPRLPTPLGKPWGFSILCSISYLRKGLEPPNGHRR